MMMLKMFMPVSILVFNSFHFSIQPSLPLINLTIQRLNEYFQSMPKMPESEKKEEESAESREEKKEQVTKYQMCCLHEENSINQILNVNSRIVL